MIGTLFRQDIAVYNSRIVIPIFFFAGLFGRIIAGELPPETGTRPLAAESGILILFFCQACLLLLFLLTPTSFWARSGSMHLALPLSARKLWLARMISLLFITLVPFLALCLPVSLRSSTTTAWLVPDPMILKVTLHTAAGLLLVVALYQVPSPSLHRIRIGLGYILYVTFVALGTVLFVVFTAPASVFTLILLVAGMACLMWVYFSLPKTFVVSPLTLDPDGSMEEKAGVRPYAPGVQVTVDVAGSSRWFLHRTVARTILNYWPVWIILPLLALYGGLVVRSYYQGKAPFPYILFIGGWIWGMLRYSMSRLHMLDPLPVSRKIVYGQTMGACLLAVLLGMGVFSLGQLDGRSRAKMVSFYQEQVRVPREYYEIAPNGQAPVITSPWGETHSPTLHSVLPGSRFALYNPFERGEESSARFIKLQIDRAIERIHEVPVPAATTDLGTPLDRSFEEDLEDCCFTTEASLGRGSESRSKTYALGMILYLLVSSAVIALSFRIGGARLRSWLYVVPTIGALAVVVIVLLGAAVLEGLGYSETWVWGALSAIPVRKLAEALPLSSLFLWSVFLASLVACYFWIQASFLGIEAPVRRMVKKFVTEY
jgi:hypothetical protein